ncbi:deoxyribose-phosphate aldolase [Pelagibius marinus]|uniref:deoxyribose-phosphate aldolase n=1 Tax=Pelagibius marinus TaxID=2762760 RepID=UPI001872AD5C|nr:deoxyribose-phosphate aldolase [Pelagibius marinus]
MSDQAEQRKAVAERAIRLLDLTSLGDKDDDAVVSALCNRALAAPGPLAAVCIWPRFVTEARGLLEHSGIRVAAVANFPAGGDDLDEAVKQTEDIVNNGGDEVDLVMPYNRWLAGDTAAALDMIALCKKACGDHVLLKVILETGRLGETKKIYEASRDAIAAGADFIKTSTGKVEVSATLEAAEVMLQAIKDSAMDVGFKAAGGIRDTETAGQYLALADRIMGEGWADPRHFRFGASGLLDDLLAVLGVASAPADVSRTY